MEETRDTIKKEVKLRLADGIINIELDDEHLDLSINKALEKLRQRAETAMDESFIALTLQTNQSEYILDENIISVMNIYERNITSFASGDSAVEFSPVEGAVLASFLPGGKGKGGGSFGLSGYAAYTSFLETLRKVFATNLMYNYNNVTKRLIIHKRIRANQSVILHTFKKRDEEELFNDNFLRPIVKDLSLAFAKHIIGSGWSKFSGGVVSPSGNTTLNGDSLKTEANAEIEILLQQIDNLQGGSFTGKPFIIG